MKLFIIGREKAFGEDMELARRTEHAQYAIRELFPIAERIEREGKEIAKVNIGDPVPYFGTPDFLRKAYEKALEEERTGYGRSPGEMIFLKAISERYRRKYGVEYDPNHIFVTQGVSEAISFLNMCLMEKGKGAVLFSPFYPSYEPMVWLYDGKPYLVQCDEERDWAPDVGRLEDAIRNAKKEGVELRYILLINPCNPTGALWERKELLEVAEVAKENDLILVSDEIYDEIVFGEKKFESAAELIEDQPLIITNGLSKGWMATGFRIGWMIIPGEDSISEKLRDAITRLGTLRLCPSVPAQYAGADALSKVEEHKQFIDGFNKEVKERSDFMWKRLNEIDGVCCNRAYGAFYLFPKIELRRSGCGSDSEFVRKLLEEQRVWAVQGSGFGLPGHLRIVTLPPKDVLGKAADGIERMMKGNVF